jgi:hypothetical protein
MYNGSCPLQVAHTVSFAGIANQNQCRAQNNEQRTLCATNHRQPEVAPDQSYAGLAFALFSAGDNKQQKRKVLCFFTLSLIRNAVTTVCSQIRRNFTAAKSSGSKAYH